MNFYYIFTEYVGKANSVDDANKLQQIVVDALRNPTKPRPAGEPCVGAMMKDFMMRAARITPLEGSTLQRFIQECDVYTAAVVKDITTNRPRKRPSGMSEYLEHRRPLSGARPMLAVLEFGLELPPEILDHPVVKGLADNAVDMICMINDMNTYPLSRSQGAEADNVISVIMTQYSLDLQTSYDYLELDIKKLVSNHLSLLGRLPSWNGTELDRRVNNPGGGGGDVDKRVALYLSGMGQWVRGNDDWCFESAKFFGADSMNVKKTRWVRFSSHREGLGRGPRISGMGLNISVIDCRTVFVFIMLDELELLADPYYMVWSIRSMDQYCFDVNASFDAIHAKHPSKGFKFKLPRMNDLNLCVPKEAVVGKRSYALRCNNTAKLETHTLGASPSRPISDCLYPSNGALGSSIRVQLT
ncbi:hypothetical protein AX16_004335 [Volvariella volvacea WC 439]|nr:hypothetical protein AX16_004335 [Volvariella volvacea WC 439]